MNTTHTPGPWAYRIWGGVPGSYRYCINDVCFEIQNEADARLIAAAPDLLEALQRLERAVDCHLGRSAQSPRLSGFAESERIRKELWAAHDVSRAAIAKAA